MTTTIDKIRPEVTAEIQDAEAFLAAIEAFPNDTDADLAELGRLLLPVKAKSKALIERRKAITRPMDAAKTSVMDLFRPAISLLGRCELALKDKISEGHDKRNTAKQAAADNAAEAGDSEAIAVAAAPAPKVKGVRTRQVVKWEVVNERLLPDHFWVSIWDEDEIDKAVKAGEDIPGVRTWTETIVSAGEKL